MLYDEDRGQVVMNPFYPCVKYKKPADPILDGTDYFIVAESIQMRRLSVMHEVFDCSLSFTCENDKKAFYKLIQDCLHF